MVTPILGFEEIPQSQNNKYITHNTALKQIERLCGAAILSIETTPPASPNVGDFYIIGVGATGIWTGLDNGLTVWNGAGWELTTPVEGVRVFDRSQTILLYFDGTAWQEIEDYPLVEITNGVENASVNTRYAVNGTTTLNFPVAVDGDRIFVIDSGETFANSNIELVPNGSDTIQGTTSVILGDNRLAQEYLYYNGNWILTCTSFTAGQGGNNSTAQVSLELRDGTFTDFSPFNHNIIVSGSVTVDGNNDYVFPGVTSNDYLAISDNDAFHFAQDNFLIEFNLKLATANESGEVYTQGISTGTTGSRAFFISGNQLQYICDTDQGRFIVLGDLPPGDYVNQFHNFKLLRDGADFFMAVDDLVIQTEDFGTASLVNSTDSLLIGSNSFTNGFAGTLTTLTVSKNPDPQNFIQPPSLVFELNGGTFDDQSTLQHPITNTGVVVDGNNDYVFVRTESDRLEVPDSDAFALGDSDFLIEFECKIVSPANSPFYGVVSQGIDNPTLIAVYFFDGDFYFQARTTTGTNFIVTTTLPGGTDFENNFNNFKVRRVGSTLTLEINDVVLSTQSVSTSFINSGNPLVIGNSDLGGNRTLDGTIRFLRITNEGNTILGVQPIENNPDAVINVTYTVAGSTIQLANDSEVVQAIDPDGTSRDVVLPTTPQANTYFEIINDSDNLSGSGNTLVVKDGATTIETLDDTTGLASIRAIYSAEKADWIFW